MKLSRMAARIGFAAAIVGGSLMAGCTGRTVIVDRREPAARTEIVVVDSPPADREEIPPPARLGYAWVPGHYRYNGRNYVWIGGQWEPIPRENARYMPGRWNRTERGYVWIEGRWD